jgi:hypothetical protein
MHQIFRRVVVVALLAGVGTLAAARDVSAQYFGRNKVQYRTFDFQILKTEHFDVYYYAGEEEAARLASRLAERWYERLSRFFTHQLRGRQSIILYAASAHFRQTNAVEGLIGEGTGGLTEALKRRIVLPMSGSIADTDHVLGHELVHAFQFDITGNDPRETFTEAPDILQFPLWFAEGMAEYLTLGPVDTHTAMWLRDAALNEKLPHLKDLEDPDFFPYRWGHAFWAFIGAKYGDRAVASLLRSGANPRADLKGLALQLGTDPDTLTNDWHEAIRTSTRAVAIEPGSPASEPRLVIGRQTGSGRYNLGPRLSPDGREIAFFSERGRFSIDLFIADAGTGKILRKLSSLASDPHFDSLEFLNSAGAWSPDSKMLAFAAIRGGRPVIALIDSKSGRIRREIKLPGLDDAVNPAYAPDGRSIAFSGNRGGLMDLYRVGVEGGEVEQLTNDPFADLEPSFAPDGRTIVFVTERFSMDVERLAPGPLRLARLDVVSRDVRLLSGFLGGKHLSPQVSADGRWVTFIADPDGVNNLYRIAIDGGPVMRLSSLPTGVAGIAATSPALSQAGSTGDLAFSVFEQGAHAIYLLKPEDIVETVPPAVTRQAALLPGRSAPSGDVQALLSDAARGLPPRSAATPSERYGGKLTLDFVEQPTFSGGVTEFGPYFTGGASAFFSDMLGDKMLAMSAQAGGGLADFGGQLVYVNRRQRWNWAASVESMPYPTGYQSLVRNTSTGRGVLGEVIERQTSRGAFFTAAFPFNTAMRLEVGGGARQLTFSRTTREREFDTVTGEVLERRETTIRIGEALYVAEPSTAVVWDTSFFGATSPILGARARVGIGQTIGTIKYTTFLADVRKYFMPVKPVTIAVRGLHFARYGIDSDHVQLAQFYAGHQELVHGYGLGSFDIRDFQTCDTEAPDAGCDIFNNLRGSRMLVANVEVRAPLVGLFTGEMDYGRVPLEVAGFFDAGLVWSASEQPEFLGGSRRLVRSAGVAARVNAFGFLIVEAAFSRPLDRANRGWQFQIGLRQGF